MLVLKLWFITAKFTYYNDKGIEYLVVLTK